ncbi:MAG TPA: hypothetical protein VNP03_23460 [Pseudonocardia sp.]|nr:hypothetical protein [Pseudonocardia sp.]
MQRSTAVPTTASWARVPGGVGSALGFGAAIVATLLGWGIGAGSHPVVGLGLLAAVAVGVGVTTTVIGAVAASAQCWGMYSGFELHRLGELRLDPASSAALLLLLGLGLAASLLGLAVTSRRECRPLAGSTPALPAMAGPLLLRPSQPHHPGRRAG